jgi:hypothetical protein
VGIYALSELDSESMVFWILSCDRHVVESKHPFCQIMEILAISIPSTLRVFLSDPEATQKRIFVCGISKPLLSVSIFSQSVVDIFDQRVSLVEKRGLSGAIEKGDKVADREGIGPKISRFVFRERFGFPSRSSQERAIDCLHHFQYGLPSCFHE